MPRDTSLEDLIIAAQRSGVRIQYKAAGDSEEIDLAPIPREPSNPTSRRDAVHEDAADLRNALGYDPSDRTPWIVLIRHVAELASARAGASDLDERCAELRRVLGHSGRKSWEQLMEIVASLAEGQGWIQGWGRVQKLGHVTLYGHAKTRMIGDVPMVYVNVPELMARWDYTTGGRFEYEAQPEKEHFFPLASLYGFEPMTHAEVMDRLRLNGGRIFVADDVEPAPAPPVDRAACATLTLSAPRVDPPTPEELREREAKHQRAADLVARMVLKDRASMGVGEVLVLNPTDRAELEAWVDAGCPDPAPQSYQDAEETPF